jgi:hypothetical protein
VGHVTGDPCLLLVFAPRVAPIEVFEQFGDAHKFHPRVDQVLDLLGDGNVAQVLGQGLGLQLLEVLEFFYLISSIY